MADDRERAHVHRRIRSRVEHHSGSPEVGTSGKGDQHVSGVGNRGIRQQALDVVLHQRGDVAQRHRESG